jgi:hypothetical protein
MRLPELLSVALAAATDACVLGHAAQSDPQSDPPSDPQSARAAVRGAEACARQALSRVQVDARAEEPAATAAPGQEALRLWDLVGFGEPAAAGAGAEAEAGAGAGAEAEAGAHRDAAAVAALGRHDLAALVASAGFRVPLHARGLSGAETAAVAQHAALRRCGREAVHRRTERLVQLVGREAALAALAQGASAHGGSGFPPGPSFRAAHTAGAGSSADQAKQQLAAHWSSCAQERSAEALARRALLATLLAPASSASSGSVPPPWVSSERRAALALVERLTAPDGSRGMGSGGADDGDDDDDLSRLRAAAATALAAHRAVGRSRGSSDDGDSGLLLRAAADCALVAAVVLPRAARQLGELVPVRGGGGGPNCLAAERCAFESLGE